MPAKQKNEAAEESTITSEIGALRRIGNLLALLVVKGEKQDKQIQTLSSAGFSNTEIASLLATTPGNVGQTLYTLRKGSGPTKRRAKKS